VKRNRSLAGSCHACAGSRAAPQPLARAGLRILPRGNCSRAAQPRGRANREFARHGSRSPNACAVKRSRSLAGSCRACAGRLSRRRAAQRCRHARRKLQRHRSRSSNISAMTRNRSLAGLCFECVGRSASLQPPPCAILRIVPRGPLRRTCREFARHRSRSPNTNAVKRNKSLAGSCHACAGSPAFRQTCSRNVGRSHFSSLATCGNSNPSEFPLRISRP
jgi:hypothetical protein